MTEICYPKTAKLLTVEQAQSAIQQAIAGVEQTESIPLSQGLDRVLALTPRSPIDIPPQRTSAMDGYALCSTDIIENQPFNLQLIGCSWAGQPFSGHAYSGQCVRIFTGAVVPEFADSVIAQEQVQTDDQQIQFPVDTRPYKNIRAAGSDVKQQQSLVVAPKTLTASDLSLLAAAGISEVCVKRRLNIAFFSTGDELVALGTSLANGQIYDSNRYLLAGLLSDLNHRVTDLGIVKDNLQQLEKTLLDAATQYDVIISSGGASVGDADFIRQALEKCGQVNFWKIAIKPGKPLAFGKVGNCWFFGLPGNPVAVRVTFDKFVSPALQSLAGAPIKQALQLSARCETSLRKSTGRVEYQRGILRQTAPGEFAVRTAGTQDSHQLSVTSSANCYIVLEADCSTVEVGQSVIVEPFTTLI